MKRVALVLLAFFVFEGAALAVPIYFHSRTAFNAAAGALATESFEVPYPVTLPQASIPYLDFTVSETGGTADAIASTAYNPAFGSYPVTDGRDAIWYDDNGNSVGGFLFNSSIRAFGVDVTVDEAGISMFIGGNLSHVMGLTQDTPAFFGVIDLDGFNWVTFTASGAPLVGFDNLAYSQTAVPEPASLLLLGTGLIGAVRAVRKRRG